MCLGVNYIDLISWLVYLKIEDEIIVFGELLSVEDLFMLIECVG